MKAKRYAVDHEYIDLWYGGAAEDEIDAKQEEGYTRKELEYWASEWGRTLKELLEQVHEI